MSRLTRGEGILGGGNSMSRAGRCGRAVGRGCWGAADAQSARGQVSGEGPKGAEAGVGGCLDAVLWSLLGRLKQGREMALFAV